MQVSLLGSHYRGFPANKVQLLRYTSPVLLVTYGSLVIFAEDFDDVLGDLAGLAKDFEVVVCDSPLDE